MQNKRPRTLPSETIKATCGCGNIFITFTYTDTMRPYEIFGHLGKGSQCGRVQTSVTGKTCSHALRAGVPAEKMMKDMLGETCDRWSGSPTQCRSCADAFGRVIGYALGLIESDLVTAIKKEEEK